MLRKTIAGKYYTYNAENKTKKNLGLLYRAKEFVNEESPKIFHFSYIHSHLNYANVPWTMTYFTKLKTIQYLQKHASQVIFNENILNHSRPLLKSLNVLNSD